MIDEMKENEKQADSVGVTVDMNTGERSDNVPSFEIVEDQGVKYIAADKVEEYRQHKAAELAAMQTEIDDTLNAIAEIDRINAVEERQAEMQKLIDQYGEDEYSGLITVTNFDDAAEVDAMKQFITATYQASHGDPSAGFGKSKQAEPANSYKNQYEYGQKMARQAYEKRRR